MDEVSELRFSHPGITATLIQSQPRAFDEGPNPRYGHFAVKVSGDVPPGRYDVRAVGRFGISNPRSVIVHAGPTVPVSPAHSQDAPLTLEIGNLYFATSSSSTADFYRIHATKDSPISVRLIAQTIDSRMLGMMTLLDSKHNVVKSVAGADHLDRELIVSGDVEADYLLKVHDLMYRGGSEFPYGLLVAHEESKTDPLTCLPPHTATLTEAGSATLIDEQSGPVQLAIPAFIESDFGTKDDVDVYQCELAKGQSVRIEVISHRIGQPTDARLIIQQEITGDDGKSTWNQVAVAEDAFNLRDSWIQLRTLDPVHFFTPPVDGHYRFIVRDLDTGESLGAVQRYRLLVRPADQRIQLIAFRPYPHKDANTTQPIGSHLIRGGTAAIRVIASRSNWSGEIRVSVKNLPEGVSCPDAVMASGQNTVQLVLSAAEDAPASITDLKLVAHASIGGAPTQLPVSVASYQWEKNAYRGMVRSRMTDSLMLKVSDQDTHPLRLIRENSDPVKCKKGEKPKLVFKVTRSDRAKQPIIFRARDLPPGVSAGDVTLAADKDQLEYTLNVTNNAKPGSYTMWLQGEIKVKFAANPQALARITEYHARLKKMRDDTSLADQHGELDKAMAEAAKQLESVKKQTAPVDLVIYPATPTVTLVIE